MTTNQVAPQPSASNNPGWLPYLLLLVAGTAWGVTFSLARISTSEGAHPVGITFWQAVLGGLILLVVCAFQGKRPRFDRQNRLRYLIIGFLGTALPSSLFFYAARELPAGIMSITVALVPILTYAASAALGLERFVVRRFLGVLLGFAGIALLTRPEALPDPSMLVWLIMALLCSVAYTTENLYVEQVLPSEVDMMVLLTGGFFAAALMIVPVMLAMNAFVPLSWPPGPPEYAIVSMAGISAFCYLVFLRLIKSAGAVFASLMGYVITITGVAWGMLLFDEQHSTTIWLVLLLMLAGMGLVKPLRKHTVVSAGPLVNPVTPEM